MYFGNCLFCTSLPIGNPCPNILPKKNYVMGVSMDDNLVAKAGFLDSPFGQELKCRAAVYWQTWPSHASIFRFAAFAWLAFANFESDQWDFLLIKTTENMLMN